MRALRSVLVAACMVGISPALLRAQEAAARFPITTVGDSTLGFAAGSARWVKAGLQGRAVDPARRDTMVARFRVLSVRDGAVTALITGQTTAVRVGEHVAVLMPLRRSWIKSGTFWAGLFVGAALGVGAGLATS